MRLFKKKRPQKDIEQIDTLSENLMNLIEYQHKNTLLGIIRTGECLRKTCVGTCIAREVCRRTKIRMIGGIPYSLKEEAAKEYVKQYGKEGLFEELL